MLVAFHAGARRGPEITAEGGRDALRARWADNFEELRRFRATVLDDGLVAELQRWALGFLDGREPLLAARQRAGRIVDGHGDLLTGDIFCLDDGPGCWTAWSSTTGCATSTGSMMPLSWPWTWSTAALRSWVPGSWTGTPSSPASAHAELIALQCTAPPEVVAQRLREPAGSVSDADEAIGRAVAAHADPWPQASPIPTGGSVPDAVAAARLRCDQGHPSN